MARRQSVTVSILPALRASVAWSARAITRRQRDVRLALPGIRRGVSDPPEVRGKEPGISDRLAERLAMTGILCERNPQGDLRLAGHLQLHFAHPDVEDDLLGNPRQGGFFFEKVIFAPIR